jgi:hypothetical protein
MSANLGKIAITIGGDHIISNAYERLTIVKSTADVWYISVWDVPSNIALTDQGYWVVFYDAAFNSKQIADNAQAIVGILQTLDTKSDVGHTHDYVPLTDVDVLSTINTIAKRDAGGDIHARLFRSEFTTPNSNCNYFMTQIDTATNNYIRPSSVAQVRAKLLAPTTAWISATLVNGFTQWCKYRKLGNGMVEVQLYAINSGGSSSYADTIVCTLPVGFRPSVIQRKAISSSRVGYTMDGYINVDGTLHTQTVGAYYHFANFIYYTGA